MLPPPTLFVVSGPSGSGKGEALAFIRDELAVERVVTYTTRAPRPGETDGVDYHYVSHEQFLRLEADGRLLEFNRTYGSHLYASPMEVLSYREDTPDQVMELDPEGYFYARAHSSRRVVGVFVTVDDLAVLDERIAQRAPEADVARRLAVARKQLAQAWVYDHVLLNDDLDRFRDDLRAVVAAEQAAGRGRRALTGVYQALRAEQLDDVQR